MLPFQNLDCISDRQYEMERNYISKCRIYYEDVIQGDQMGQIILNSVIFKFMLTQQREFQSLKPVDELDQLSTSGDSFADIQKKSILEETNLALSKILAQGLHHHDIAANVSKSTFTSDKLLKLSSAIVKVIRSYNLTDSLKPYEKLGGQIGQVRRLLRVDRVLMLLKEFAAFYKKKHTSLSDKLMIIFKIMILMEDLTDLRSFLIQLKMLKGEHLLGTLRQKVASYYFLECVGWFIYHGKEYYKSKTEEDEYKNKMAMLKYVLDGLLAYNELSSKLFNISPKSTAILSVLSAALNIYLVWK